MESRTSLLLTILGLLLLELGSGQRGDMDINQWMMEKEKLIKNLEDKLSDVEQCKNKVEAIDGKLSATVDKLTRQKTETVEVKKENDDLKTRLDAAEKEIEKLKQNGDTAALQVAFSVSLVDSGELYKGPCTDKTLIFKRVFSNVGNAYSLITGIFTAPVNGFYYFTLSTYGYNTHTAGAILMKNNVRQVSTYDSPSADGADTGSNAAVLQLAAGDSVHVELWDNGRVFDNLNGHTTFSGFLLYPL